jgi:hypothetical protein
MRRGAKGVVLLVLLAAVVGCLRILSLGQETQWAMGLEAGSARTVFRVLVIAMGLAAWFTSQSLIAQRGMPDAQIGDAVHDWTASWNGWLADHPRVANALLVASSGGIDVFGVFLLGSSLLGPSLRPGVGLLLLFDFRQISQLTCALPAPPGMIWRRPGIPSLLVTYDVANDFFFSGHTAIAVLGAIEVARVAPPWLAVVAAVAAALEALTVLVLRAHYTMDVIAAAAAAVSAAGLADAICRGF